MKLSKNNYLKARDFILTNAGMIERRLFEFYFENGNKEGIFHAVYAYRNCDGGFGHGMEADTASPESQPLFSLMALETLDEVSFLIAELICKDLMPYFESITTEKGGIPWMLRPKSEYSCNDHFNTVEEWAVLSTTAPLLEILEKCKIDTPWMKKAEQFVWDGIHRIKEKHIFCYLYVPRTLSFLQHTKNRNKATRAIKDLKNWLLADGGICKDTSDDDWGLYG
jgi:hypothetical protein